MSAFILRNVCTHNLKGLNLDLPKNCLVVITGRSGSGKSSLAFDTLYAEGQRRYVSSLSAYARQFLSLMPRPPVDFIEGLCPAIAIRQKGLSHNPRSTVGTLTELNDYLRVLYARLGVPHCPQHQAPLQTLSLEQMLAKVFALPQGAPAALLAPLRMDTCPMESPPKTHDAIEGLRRAGYRRFRFKSHWLDLQVDPVPTDAYACPEAWSVVVDRVSILEEVRNRLSDSLELSTSLSGGTVIVAPLPAKWGLQHAQDGPALFSELRMTRQANCPQCELVAPELQPKHFSFNHPEGACEVCSGLGEVTRMDANKLLYDPRLSLRKGAISGWGEKSQNQFTQLEELASTEGFSLDVPYDSLTPEIQNVLWKGGGESGFSGILDLYEKKYHNAHYLSFREKLSEYLANQPCLGCQGSRLSPLARSVRLGGRTLPELCEFSLQEALAELEHIQSELKAPERPYGIPLLQEVIKRLRLLNDLGLDYLTLSRPSSTLSGGEAQRIHLASQLGSQLTGVLYVLDEPSIGLHPSDHQKLLKALRSLTNLGNSLVVVEHDEATIQAADCIVELGPGSGAAGGHLVAIGTPRSLCEHPTSETGHYLSGRKRLTHPSHPLAVHELPKLSLRGAWANNLKGVELHLPLGGLTCITGVSGSGKSTLINEVLYPALEQAFSGRMTPQRTALSSPTLEGLQGLGRVIQVNQEPIGRTPRSNAATYTGVFKDIRHLFTKVPEACARGYTTGRFSFNVSGGRCEACEGDGWKQISMHFLPDVLTPCEQCGGRRYNRETCEIRYKGKSIDQVLAMSIDQASHFFAAHPELLRHLAPLQALGLGYLSLGQSATTLSGGEAQRIKLAKELARRSRGDTIYLLDEPTTGLHLGDIQLLLDALFKLRAQGNTLVVIEHHLDLIQLADWVVELGPTGGKLGGRIVFEGTPQQLTQSTTTTPTARCLQKALKPFKP